MKQNSHRDILDLELRSETSRNGKGTSCLQNVTMLTLSDTMWSMSTRIGQLRKSTVVSEITQMHIRNVFTSRVSRKSMNGRIKLSAQHTNKLPLN